MQGLKSKGEETTPNEPKAPWVVEERIEVERKKVPSTDNGGLCIYSFEGEVEALPPTVRPDDVESSCAVLAGEVFNESQNPGVVHYVGFYVGKAMKNFIEKRENRDGSQEAQVRAQRIGEKMVSKGLLDEQGLFVFVLGAAKATGRVDLAMHFLRERNSPYAPVVEAYLKKEGQENVGEGRLEDTELKVKVEAIIEARGIESQLRAIEEWLKRRRMEEAVKE